MCVCVCVSVCMCIPLFSSIPSCSLLKRSSHVVYKLFVPISSLCSTNCRNSLFISIYRDTHFVSFMDEKIPFRKIKINIIKKEILSCNLYMLQ